MPGFTAAVLVYNVFITADINSVDLNKLNVDATALDEIFFC